MISFWIRIRRWFDSNPKYLVEIPLNLDICHLSAGEVIFDDDRLTQYVNDHEAVVTYYIETDAEAEMTYLCTIADIIIQVKFYEEHEAAIFMLML